MQNMHVFAAFLRGINVGGKHKVPMEDLKNVASALGLSNCMTLLNSGNLIFESSETETTKLEKVLSSALKDAFGFEIPVIIRNAHDLVELVQYNPFKEVNVTKDTRLYVTFAQDLVDQRIALPWRTADEVFRIVEIRGRAICSVLDLSRTQTTKGMGVLENMFGKNITTRNWNTIEKMENLLKNYN